MFSNLKSIQMCRVLKMYGIYIQIIHTYRVSFLKTGKPSQVLEE